MGINLSNTKNKKEYYNWCDILKVIKSVKLAYFFYNSSYGNYVFEDWLQFLREKKYSKDLLDKFKPLQMNQVGDLLLIRYGLAEMQQEGDMWQNPNSIYRDCRSIVIDVRTNDVVVAPFRKFFNLNEVEENNIDKVLEELKTAKRVEFTNKLDGSMQCATMYKDKILLTGSMALSPKDSWRLEDGYTKLTDGHKDMIRKHPNLTFIFEYISMKDAHVVVYNEKDEGLYLIGIRDKLTGEEFSYEKVKAFATLFEVPMTQVEDITFEQVLSDMKKYKSNEKEGWVMNIDNKHRIKLKCDDYVEIHRCCDLLCSINVLIRAIANETYDDLISKVPKGYVNRLKENAKIIFEYSIACKEAIEKHYEKIKNLETKEAMLYINSEVEKTLQFYVRERYYGREFNVLKTKSRYKTFKEIEGVLKNTKRD